MNVVSGCSVYVHVGRGKGRVPPGGPTHGTVHLSGSLVVVGVLAGGRLAGMDGGTGAVKFPVDATIGTLVVGTGGRGASDDKDNDGESEGGAGGTVLEVIVSLGAGGDTMAGIVDVGVTEMPVAARPLDVVSGEVDERVQLPCERAVERRGVSTIAGVDDGVDAEVNGLVLLFPMGRTREVPGVIRTGDAAVVDEDVPFCQPGIMEGVVGTGAAAIFHVSISPLIIQDP